MLVCIRYNLAYSLQFKLLIDYNWMIETYLKVSLFWVFAKSAFVYVFSLYLYDYS